MLQTTFELVFLELYHVTESTGQPVTVVHPLGILSRAWHSHHIVASKVRNYNLKMYRIHAVSTAWSMQTSMRSHTPVLFQEQLSVHFPRINTHLCSLSSRTGPFSLPSPPVSSISPSFLALSHHTCSALVSYLTETFKAIRLPSLISISFLNHLTDV